MNVFADTNVLLDVLGNRAPFAAHSAIVWGLAESETIKASISTLSLPNLHYMLRRQHGAAFARKAMSDLQDLFEVVPLDAKILRLATDSDIADFEDAIQYYSALRSEARVLITRNPKHFPAGNVVVQTPEEFLATHFAK